MRQVFAAVAGCAVAAPARGLCGLDVAGVRACGHRVRALPVLVPLPCAEVYARAGSGRAAVSTPSGGSAAVAGWVRASTGIGQGGRVGVVWRVRAVAVVLSRRFGCATAAGSGVVSGLSGG
ncbi:hypothetical protein GCM10009662_25510 [Catellatospora coxensis]